LTRSPLAFLGGDSTGQAGRHNLWSTYCPEGSQEIGMVLEIAQIEVSPGMEETFESGVTQAAAVFRRAKGCRGMALQKSLEKPTRYRLFVRWETLENHTVDFRGSPDFQEWRKLVGHCFAAPPDVEHVREVVHGF
jgi:heme-degrading monooxygenase HmoA